MTALRVLLVVAFLAILATLAAELTRRKDPARSLVTSQQLKLRILMAALFLVLIAMILAGTFLMATQDALVQILYWSLCLSVAFLIMIVAILDVRGVLINYLIERRSNLTTKQDQQEGRRRDD